MPIETFSSAGPEPSSLEDFPVLGAADSVAMNGVVESVVPVNEVHLIGAISDPGEYRLLAGGAQVVRWSIRVSRGPEKAGTDLIDCVALDPSLQERALTWPLGTTLEVVGAIRRRFFRSGGRTATRVEVEACEVTECAASPGAEDSAVVGGVEQPDQ